MENNWIIYSEHLVFTTINYFKLFLSVHYWH